MKRKNRYAIIMAGGKGERLWPLSKEKTPKPFIKILDKPLIYLSYERIKKVVPKENIGIIVPSYLSKITKKVVPDAKVIVEPFPKNTAATCIYSTYYFYKKDKKAKIGIFPADHLIRNEDKFKEFINFAYENDIDEIITFGIKPKRAETGYGYIELGDVKLKKNGMEMRKVLRFHEKPDEKKAKKYLEAGNFMWNSGIFLWKGEVFFDIFEKANKGLFRLFEFLQKGKKRKFFEEIPNISIDYALLEKTNKIVCVPTDLDWEDLGSFLSFERVFDKDIDGNVKIGNSYSFDSKGNILFSRDKVLVVYGVSDLVVVQTDDITMVLPKHKSQKVKEILKALKGKLDKRYF